jgi:hypothetical protein
MNFTALVRKMIAVIHGLRSCPATIIQSNLLEEQKYSANCREKPAEG